MRPYHFLEITGKYDKNLKEVVPCKLIRPIPKRSYEYIHKDESGRFFTTFLEEIFLTNNGGLMLFSPEMFVTEYPTFAQENHHLSDFDFEFMSVFSDDEYDAASALMYDWATTNKNLSLLPENDKSFYDAPDKTMGALDGKKFCKGFYPSSQALGIRYTNCYLFDENDKIISNVSFENDGFSKEEITDVITLIDYEISKDYSSRNFRTLEEIMEDLLENNGIDADEPVAKSYMSLARLLQKSKKYSTSPWLVTKSQQTKIKF